MASDSRELKMIVLQNGKPVDVQELKCRDCARLLVQASNTRLYKDALLIDHDCKDRPKLLSFTILQHGTPGRP